MPSFDLYSVTNGMSPREIGGALIKSNIDNRYVMSCIGDSRLAQGSQVQTDPNGTRTNFMPNGPMSWIQVLSSGIISAPFGHNIAVSGSTSSETIAIARTVKDLNPRPTHCLILTGTNDIGSGSSAESVISNIKQIWQILIDDGISPITVCDLPRSVSSWDIQRTRISHDLNRRIINDARGLGLIVINANELIADSSSSNGDPISGYTNDGIHQTTVPSYIIGKRVVDSFDLRGSVNRPYSRSDLYDQTSNPKGNATAFGLFTGTSGTTTSSAGAVSGAVADGWNVRSLTGTGTAVCSKVSRQDAAGEYQQIVLESSSGVSTYRISLITTLTGASVVASTSSSFSAAMDFDVVGSSALEECKMMCSMFDGTNFKNGSEVMKSTLVGSTRYPYSFDWSGRMISDSVEVDLLSDQIIWRVEVRVNSGSATIRLGSASINAQ